MHWLVVCCFYIFEGCVSSSISLLPKFYPKIISNPLLTLWPLPKSLPIFYLVHYIYRQQLYSSVRIQGVKRTTRRPLNVPTKELKSSVPSVYTHLSARPLDPQSLEMPPKVSRDTFQALPHASRGPYRCTYRNK